MTSSTSKTNYLDRLLEWPAYAAMVLAGLQITVWTLIPALSHDAPPLDVVESYVWGKEWVIGTYKHPALPAWVLELSRDLTGAIGWPAYLASQIFIALTFLFVFTLGRDLMGSKRALAGVLLLTGIFYFSWPSIEFNHNVAQMPYWAGISWAVWRARQRAATQWWVLLGAMAAQSLYAKFSSALLLVVVATWLLSDPALRQQLRRPGPWVGLLVFLILAAPLLFWLLSNGFQPLVYAAERGSHSREGPLQFLGAQMLALSGMLAMLWWAGLLPRFAPVTVPSATIANPAPVEELHPLAVRYLAYMTIVPIIVPFVVGIASGSGMKSMWGAPMLSLSGLLAIALTADRFSPVALQRIARAAVAVLTVVPAGYALDTLYEARLTNRPKRQNWPQAEIAHRFATVWRQNTGTELAIVAGGHWVAGTIALKPGPMASILTLGDLSISPWISADRLRQQGVLVVWEERANRPGPPDELLPLIGNRERLQLHFPWKRFPNAPELVIGYAIVPPNLAN
jgi:4-amino-4-deoxy-L-arabinose transferase-like glycosyltransferase